MSNEVNLVDWALCDESHLQPFAEAADAAPMNYPAVHQASLPFQAPLTELLGRIEPDALRLTVRRIFDDLASLLEYLSLIEAELRHDHTLGETLPIFMVVQHEARSLLEYIESQAMRMEGISQRLHDVLDGTCYAIDMELRRAFEEELSELGGDSGKIKRANVEHAHGMLCNCFQQTVIAVAQVFDRSLDGARLFDDYQLRLQQSLSLYKDLTNLVIIVREAEKQGGSSASSLLIDALRSFRDGSMRFLMFRDWEPYERFIDEAAKARDAAALVSVLHRLGCFLETLLGVVKMRAVLADYDFSAH